MKLFSRRPDRRAHSLITIGAITLAISFIFLFWLAEKANAHTVILSVNCMRILCGLNLLMLTAGGVILFWGFSIWFRDQVFKN
ncbi:MAG: hypothetical protein M0R34_09760 [Candidatus Marinimicrobia bacterium]|jgi:hypothetical protein|nr:hypothetical protein [Candidatus Neomarinimicrobiota bacterium]MCK9560735.1 hypothetical protein [Candidatus Neomarinimicrobiota bacterium]MDD5230923.1 hypothetical protein [Candidatus Neomarinimicrobiota bacterium]